MKHRIIVELELSEKHNILEVVNLTCDLTPLESCTIKGLGDCSTLEIGSWLRKSEVRNGSGLKTKNPKLSFHIADSKQ